MDISELGITDTSKRLVPDLLSAEQSVPKETPFEDDIFAGCLSQSRESKPGQDHPGCFQAYCSFGGITCTAYQKPQTPYRERHRRME